MARPRSQDRRNAILSAATHVIASRGLGAPTAAIAEAAGVSNGSLFVYFDTKSALLNELFIELKAEMGTAAVRDLPTDAAPYEQVFHMWTRWLGWATAHPEKRRALAQLEVADEISEESHQLVRESQRGMAQVLTRSLAEGPMQDQPMGFVLTLVTAMADATIDAIIREPAAAEALGDAAFEAIWRVLGGTTGSQASARGIATSSPSVA
ncbi:TetR/AcrR family transcriptional regulator [Dactylosporangium sp. CA-092794]|uniref:TetR/AcrR family transcriptional regulator n=1 Tax=Dactylosporangium sp. CA-092794 TaxID=3239929 RepID=UPI003D8AC3ED